MYARHGRRDGIRRGPGGLEQIEADLAGLEVDVGVADWRDEADGGRGEGVVRWDMDVEGPAAAWSQSAIDFNEMENGYGRDITRRKDG